MFLDVFKSSIYNKVVKLFPPEMAFFDSLSLPGSTVARFLFFVSTDPTLILQSSMLIMVLRWYLVTKLLSGRTSTTYLRWTVAHLSVETVFP